MYVKESLISHEDIDYLYKTISSSSSRRQFVLSSPRYYDKVSSHHSSSKQSKEETIMYEDIRSTENFLHYTVADAFIFPADHLYRYSCKVSSMKLAHVNLINTDRRLITAFFIAAIVQELSFSTGISKTHNDEVITIVYRSNTSKGLAKNDEKHWYRKELETKFNLLRSIL